MRSSKYRELTVAVLDLILRLMNLQDMYSDDPRERFGTLGFDRQLLIPLTTLQEQCYDNIRVSKNAWDTNLVKANPLYLSVNWDASGGGAFAVIPLKEKGRLPEQLPLFRGHTAVVLDTDW